MTTAEKIGETFSLFCARIVCFCTFILDQHTQLSLFACGGDDAVSPLSVSSLQLRRRRLWQRGKTVLARERALFRVFLQPWCVRALSRQRIGTPFFPFFFSLYPSLFTRASSRKRSYFSLLVVSSQSNLSCSHPPSRPRVGETSFSDLSFRSSSSPCFLLSNPSRPSTCTPLPAPRRFASFVALLCMHKQTARRGG